MQARNLKDLLLIGIYAAIPNAVGVIGMIRWHFAACVAIDVVGLFVSMPSRLDA
jgi:hypothetical protein